MNYIQEINAFYDWLVTNPIPADAQALWFALMHINNKCAWLDEFTVANTTLLSILGFSRQQLDRMRNVLIQTGRIEYKKRDGRQAGIYKIISFMPNNVTQPVTQVETQPETQPVTQMETQTGHKCSTLNKLNYTKQNNISSKEEGANSCPIDKSKLNKWELEIVSAYEIATQYKFLEEDFLLLKKTLSFSTPSQIKSGITSQVQLHLQKQQPPPDFKYIAEVILKGAYGRRPKQYKKPEAKVEAGGKDYGW